MPVTRAAFASLRRHGDWQATPRLRTTRDLLAALVTGKPVTVFRAKQETLVTGDRTRESESPSPRPHAILHPKKVEHPLPHCVYVLLSLKDDNFYVGYTTNLPRRLDEHFQGRNTSTAPRRPFVLVHCEHYVAKADAERRENYLKTAKGRRVLRLMLQHSQAEARPQASERQPSVTIEPDPL